MKQKLKLLLMMYGVWLCAGGLLMLCMGFPMLFVKKPSYNTGSAGIAICAFGLLIMLAGFLLVHRLRVRDIKRGINRSRGWYVAIGIFAAIIIFTCIGVSSTVKKSDPAASLKERQITDMAPLAQKNGFLSRSWESYWDPTEGPDIHALEEYRGKSWLIVRTSGYESGYVTGQDAKPVAWSDAHFWAGFYWLDVKPTEEEIKDIDILVICRYNKESASYEKTSGGFGGCVCTTEFVDMMFIDVSTGQVIYGCRIGTPLPSAVTGAINYEVSADDLANTATGLLDREY